MGRKQMSISLGQEQKVDDNKLFDDKNLNKNGIQFFDSVILDPIGIENARLNKEMQNRKKEQNDKGFLVSRSGNLSNSDDSEKENIEKPRKRRRKVANTENQPEILNSEDELYNFYYKPKKAEDGSGVFCQV